MLLTKQEVENLEIDDLKTKIETALDYNEWDWLDAHPEIKFNHKTIAEGLENILCICPKCGKKHSLKTSGNQITCENCDLAVSLDDRYGLSGVDFKNIA